MSGDPSELPRACRLHILSRDLQFCATVARNATHRAANAASENAQTSVTVTEATSCEQCADNLISHRFMLAIVTHTIAILNFIIILTTPFHVSMLTSCVLCLILLNKYHRRLQYHSAPSAGPGNRHTASSMHPGTLLLWRARITP